MAIVVEDGTGLSNAESYVTVAFCDTYFSDRGDATWTGTDAEKEEALRKATEYLDVTYTWIGSIKVDTQALGWPRDGAWDKEGRSLEDIVPLGVERATAEAALKALSASLLADTTNSDFVTKEKVDVIEVEYASGAPSGTQYNYITRLLKGLTIGSSGGSQSRLLRS
jgi:hypothetical protein